MPRNRELYVATIQIAMEGPKDHTEAQEEVSVMMDKAPTVYDWSYLRVGQQYLYPHRVLSSKDDYFEEKGGD